MIPYQELCAALERYAHRQGAAAGGLEAAAQYGEAAAPGYVAEVSNVEPIYDDRSNELDIGDVLSDEEAPKN
jgi:hypothetical protein